MTIAYAEAGTISVGDRQYSPPSTHWFVVFRGAGILHPVPDQVQPVSGHFTFQDFSSNSIGKFVVQWYSLNPATGVYEVISRETFPKTSNIMLTDGYVYRFASGIWAYEQLYSEKTDEEGRRRDIYVTTEIARSIIRRQE